MVICDVVFNYVLLFPLGELTRCYLASHYFAFTGILRRDFSAGARIHVGSDFHLGKDSPHSMIVNHNHNLSDITARRTPEGLLPLHF